MIAIYDEVDNIFVADLRQSIVNCMEVKENDEEIAQLAANDPEKLSNDELLIHH